MAERAVMVKVATWVPEAQMEAGSTVAAVAAVACPKEPLGDKTVEEAKDWVTLVWVTVEDAVVVVAGTAACQEAHMEDILAAVATEMVDVASAKVEGAMVEGVDTAAQCWAGEVESLAVEMEGAVQVVAMVAVV